MKPGASVSRCMSWKMCLFLSRLERCGEDLKPVLPSKPPFQKFALQPVLILTADFNLVFSLSLLVRLVLVQIWSYKSNFSQ